MISMRTLSAAAKQGDRASSLPSWIPMGLAGLLACILSALAATHIAFPQTAWVPLFSAALPWQAWVLLPITLLTFLIWRKDQSRSWSRVLPALLLFGLYLSVSLQRQYGDTFLYDLERIVAEGKKEIFGSSMGGYSLYLAVFHQGWDRAYVAPVMGLLTALAYFKTVDTFVFYNVAKPDPRKAALAGALYLASGVHWLFFRGFQEMSFPAMPFLLLSLLFAVRYLRANPASQDAVPLLASGFLLGCACVIHGQNTFLLPALLVLVVLRRWGSRERVIAVFDVLLALFAAFVALALFVCVIQAFGYHLTPHDVYGGGDGITFVPWKLPENTQYIRFTLLTFAHAREVANILAVLSPIIFTLPFLLAQGLRARIARSASGVFLLIVCLGVMAFLLPYNFDLGYPKDVDLMTAMGTPLLLLTGLELGRARPWVGWTCALVGIVLSWSVVAAGIAGTV